MDDLDLSGLVCPHVVLRLAERLRAVAPGTRLRVLATDPMSAIDVPFYLGKVGHVLVSQQRTEGRVTFIVERGRC